MIRVLFGLIALILILSAGAMGTVSEETQACLDCHSLYTPGIVEDWLSSRHSNVTVDQALELPRIERRVTNENVSEVLRSVSIGCYECHTLNTDKHQDSFEHFDYKINLIVSPNDCATCHSEEVSQYTGSKKAHALGNLQDNELFSLMVSTHTSVKNVSETEIGQLEASENAKNESCYACHGTEVIVRGLRTVETDLGDIEVLDLDNWPNQGVGRVNPDGSLGACTSCHPRHSFSIEIARKPYTCSQCHLEPDVPAWQVYKESKHGNIFSSIGSKWEWNSVPWVLGKDFKAPSCAVCHNSLVVNSEGDEILPRTHDFGARIWQRIFGLIYSHPQTISGQTSIIRNSDSQPLPTTFDGEIAAEYLISEQEQQSRQDDMKSLCRNCHGRTWADEYFVKFDSTVTEADMMVASATRLIMAAWELNLEDKSNPFDETIEFRWVRQWLFYANSLRYASAMSGPDYAAFKNGWWSLTENLQLMKDFIEQKQALRR